MKQVRTGLLYSVFSFAAFSAYGQTRIIDSLKGNIRTVTSEKEKVKALFDLCELGYTLHPDTLMLYAENARIIARRLDNLHDEVQALYYKSGALTTKGLIDSWLY